MSFRRFLPFPTLALALAVLALSADARAQPANDACASPTVIASAPFSTTGNVAAATTEAGDPNQSCGSIAVPKNTKSVWFSFVAPASGTVIVDTFGSDYDTVMTAYTGSCATPT